MVGQQIPRTVQKKTIREQIDWSKQKTRHNVHMNDLDRKTREFNGGCVKKFNDTKQETINADDDVLSAVPRRSGLDSAAQLSTKKRPQTFESDSC